MRQCPLCTDHRAHTYMKPTAWNNRHGIELKKCIQCAFVYSAESVCDYTTTKNRFADKTKEQLLDLAKQDGIDLLAHEIEQKTKLQEGTVLDFGCGVGFFALTLQQQGFVVHGIESSLTYVEHLQRLGIKAAQTLTTLEVPKQYFDLIILKDVLEHVDEPIALLQELVPFLKPNGYIYIRVPNINHYSFHWSIDTKSHINHFAPHQLFNLLERQQLKVIDFINVFDISTRAGKWYHAVFWKTRRWLPMYHQISLLCQKI